MSPDGPAEPDLAFQARCLARRGRAASLATARRGTGGGWPMVSLVTVAWDVDASPILLLSGLADHTQNLRADDRASLMVDEARLKANPQTGPRVTLMGRVAPVDDPALAARARARFLARHPEAGMYAGFGDFAFYRLAVERAHLVGGFARAHWIGAAQWPPDPAAVAAIGALADGAVAHLNADHPDAATLYATRLLGRRGTGWTVTGVDPDGLDLRREDRFARLDFPAPVADGDALRTALAKRSDQARGQGS